MATATLESVSRLSLLGVREQINSDQTVEADKTYKYDHLVPRSDTNIHLPALEPFEHNDRGE